MKSGPYNEAAKNSFASLFLDNKLRISRLRIDVLVIIDITSRVADKFKRV